MKIGIAVFAYNRSQHLRKVLEGLKKNVGVDKLYIFHDGLKCEADREEWDNTKELINSIKWCETKIFSAEMNKGLADSIIEGINIVFEENEAIVVLEDDCVPEPSFVQFMKQCFEVYRDNKEIYSVSGYSWPIDVDKKEGDIYLCGRPCPWGWGTWKDRWHQYKREYNIIIDIKKDREASKRLAIWGDDLEGMLISNIQGRTNSWYVFWALLLIKEKKYAINPYKSLIRNEGFDGSGVHCGQTEKFDVLQIDKREARETFSLTNDVSIALQTQKAFIDLYGSHTVDFDKSDKERILVYGIGNCYKRYAKQIREKYIITAFVDRNKQDKYYAGIEIIHPKQLVEKEYCYIVIMIEDDIMSNVVKQELIDIYGVDANTIILKHEM